MSSRSRASALATASLLGAASAQIWQAPHPGWSQPSSGSPSWGGHSWGPWSAGPSSCQQHEYTTPIFHFGQFTYPATPTPTTTVTSNPTTVSPATTYAAAYSDVSSLLANVSTTSWPNWTPASAGASQTAAVTGYNDAAYSQLWQGANPLNFTRGLYSSTASPTPVPTSDLQAPPNLYFSPETCYPFPKDFVFGAAGSASQCEGAVADQGKSPSFMDMLFTIFTIVGGASSVGGGTLGGVGGSKLEPNYVSIENYYLYKRDIDRLAAMGLKYYSFSISWTRILPFALAGTPVNSYGLQHYDDVINYALEKGLELIVTITHFDTPLQFFGGGEGNYLLALGADLTNTTYGIGGVTWGYSNETFVESYVNYAKIVLSHYADRVPYWVTFNEPQLGTTNGQAVYNVLSAHAQVHHFYKEELRGTGKMSMKMGITPAVPRDSTNATDVAAANWFSDLYVGSLLNPLALGEDQPDAYKLSVADHVPLTAEDLEFMNNTMDYVSIDGYSAPVVSANTTNITACAINPQDPAHTFPFCVLPETTTLSGWSTGYSPFGSPTNIQEPMGLRTQLNYCYNTWKKPVFISEFGLSIPAPPGGRLQDNLFNKPQSEYLLSYLNEMLKAYYEDGVEVMGGLVWNFADDWEFGDYSPGFGLQYVNRTTQERIYRRSFFDVVGFVEGNRAS